MAREEAALPHPIVVGASIAMSWIFEDERDEFALDIAQYVDRCGALAPVLWRWEVQNTLLSALRRKRIDEDQLANRPSDIEALPIEFDVPFGFGTEVALARQFNLTVYDAAYLELAMRRNCHLATKDVALRKAAKVSGVPFTSSSTSSFGP